MSYRKAFYLVCATVLCLAACLVAQQKKNPGYTDTAILPGDQAGQERQGLVPDGLHETVRRQLEGGPGLGRRRPGRLSGDIVWLDLAR